MADSAPANTPGFNPQNERPSSSSIERHEQRLYPRFKVDGSTAFLGKPGLLSQLGFSPKKFPVVNISQGGVMLKLAKPLSPKSRISLTIEIPRVQEVIRGDGEIRWCAQGARNNKEFYAGVAFVNLPAAEHQKIVRMQELFTSQEYRAKAGARKGSSAHLKAIKF